MPFLSPNQQCQSTEGKISHSTDLLTPSSPGGLPALSLTTKGSWLPWGELPSLWSALWHQYPATACQWHKISLLKMSKVNIRTKTLTLGYYPNPRKADSVFQRNAESSKAAVDSCRDRWEMMTSWEWSGLYPHCFVLVRKSAHPSCSA